MRENSVANAVKAIIDDYCSRNPNFGQVDVLDAIAYVLCEKHLSKETKFCCSLDKNDYYSLFHNEDVDWVREHRNIDLIVSDFAACAHALLKEFNSYTVTIGASKLMGNLLFGKERILNPDFDTVEHNVVCPGGGDDYFYESFYWNTDEGSEGYSEYVVSSDYFEFSRFYELYVIAKRMIGYRNIFYLEEFMLTNSTYPRSYVYIPNTWQYNRYGLISTIKSWTEKLAGDGRLVALVPADILDKDDYFTLRDYLIDSRRLSYVIRFRRGESCEEWRGDMAALVVEGKPTDERSFTYVDLTSVSTSSYKEGHDAFLRIIEHDRDICRKVKFSSVETSASKILEPSGDSDLIEKDGFEFTYLEMILSPYRNWAKIDSTEPVFRLSGKDMHLSLPEYSMKVTDLHKEVLTDRFLMIDRPVLCFHAITRKYMWLEASRETPAYCNGDIYLFEIIDNSVTPEYLCHVLGENYIQDEIEDYVKGSIPRISSTDLLKIRVPVPSSAVVLERYISQRKSRIATKIYEETEQTLEDIREDIEDKIHLIAPYNANIQSGILLIISMLNNGEILNAHTQMDSNTGMELVPFLNKVLNESEMVGSSLSSFGKSFFDEVSSPIDAVSFMKDYVRNLQMDHDDIEFVLHADDDCLIMMDERALTQTLDTIIRNAIRHGFCNSFKGTKRIRIDLRSQDKYVLLSVANNGAKADSRLSKTLYSQRSGKCGDTANTGRGGYLVKRAMDFYKGDFEIKTDDNEWPFIITLKIPSSHE